MKFRFNLCDALLVSFTARQIIGEIGRIKTRIQTFRLHINVWRDSVAARGFLRAIRSAFEPCCACSCGGACVLWLFIHVWIDIDLATGTSSRQCQLGSRCWQTEISDGRCRDFAARLQIATTATVRSAAACCLLCFVEFQCFQLSCALQCWFVTRTCCPL